MRFLKHSSSLLSDPQTPSVYGPHVWYWSVLEGIIRGTLFGLPLLAWRVKGKPPPTPKVGKAQEVSPIPEP